MQMRSTTLKRRNRKNKKLETIVRIVKNPRKPEDLSSAIAILFAIVSKIENFPHKLGQPQALERFDLSLYDGMKFSAQHSLRPTGYYIVDIPSNCVTIPTSFRICGAFFKDVKKRTYPGTLGWAPAPAAVMLSANFWNDRLHEESSARRKWWRFRRRRIFRKGTRWGQGGAMSTFGRRTALPLAPSSSSSELPAETLSENMLSEGRERMTRKKSTRRKHRTSSQTVKRKQMMCKSNSEKNLAK